MRGSETGITMKAMKRGGVAGTLLLLAVGCGPGDGPVGNHPETTTLVIGVAAPATGDADAGMRQTAENLTFEGLLNYGRDGRPVPFLASQWSRSDDGLALRLQLQPAATFHDGSPVTAAIVRDSLLKGLPRNLGPAFEDVQEIRAPSDHEVEIVLKQPSAFAIEALDVPIAKSGARRIGTGPFELVDGGTVANGGTVEMRSNPNYYLGRPAVDHIMFKPYASVRSAWADLLRGQVDMLYEVGVDALDSMQPSKQVSVFSYRRHYAYVVIFNTNRPALRDPAVRRRLNAAINRQQLIEDALGGRGAPATGPVWPAHWANQPDAPGFNYAPEDLTGRSGATPRIRLRCLFGNPDFERLALVVQRQLQSVGVDLDLEVLPADSVVSRWHSADFDLILTDAISGPSLARPYLFWHSQSPLNYGRFSSRAVDASLDAIRHAPDDDAYKGGVAAFQRAIMDDPPALFLAWIERARLVSTRFAVPAEPERDVWSSLRLWRPVAGPATASRN
jgi:peptide/nickel transport system substrate-binding protein